MNSAFRATDFDANNENDRDELIERLLNALATLRRHLHEEKADDVPTVPTNEPHAVPLAGNGALRQIIDHPEAYTMTDLDSIDGGLLSRIG
jgi:hypothetical protein